MEAEEQLDQRGISFRVIKEINYLSSGSTIGVPLYRLKDSPACPDENIEEVVEQLEENGFLKQRSSNAFGACNHRRPRRLPVTGRCRRRYALTSKSRELLKESPFY
jgi:hypothetical protein